MRLNRLRRQKEKLRFWEEFRIVPTWLKALVAVLYVLAMGSPTHPIAGDCYQAWTATYQWENMYGHDFFMRFRGFVDGWAFSQSQEMGSWALNSRFPRTRAIYGMEW